MSDTLTRLRRRIEALAPSAPDMAEAARRISLGVTEIDHALDGGLKRGTLHEAYAAQTPDGAALAGFAAAPSRPLAANAPGPPAFDVTLLRNRAGASGQRWRVEWDHDRHQFRDAAPLSGDLVSVPAERPAGMASHRFARAG